MPLAPGVRLGPYEIIDAIGAGGMGEVYRGRDTRLDRTVAIKVLPDHLAPDPQLRERFDREARAISSLNHPHICALYDVGRDGGGDYLVMEYLEGQTLAGRLGAGLLPVADALRWAIQIADALDRAHRSGIVHRDLKPANIFLASGGGGSAPPVAKLLDFGLAKMAAPVVSASRLSMLPTTPPGLTAEGTILGTFQYMAPEQIEGLEADARTDIFAFGALVYEMMTGRPAFEGNTRASLLSAILKDEPPPISRVRSLAPAALDHIAARCLAKDPDDRWQSVRDLLHELKWIATGGAEGPVQSGAAVRRRASWISWSAAGMLAILLGAAATVAVRHWREARPAVEPIQFTVNAPEGYSFGGPVGAGTGQAAQIAVSPDSQHVAFIASAQGGFGLWLRSLGAPAPRLIPGTDAASFPFWSPDSRFVAFFASGKLKKVQIASGPLVVVCDAESGRGGTWGGDNIIVFAPAFLGPLQRVSAAGGTPADLTALDRSYGETNHRFPHFLPDGRHFLYTAVTGPGGAAPRMPLVKIGSLDSPDVTTLFQGESSAAFATDHLFFVRDGNLMAQPFDAVNRQLTGEPFPVAEQVATESSHYASFSVSSSGVLAYVPGTSGFRRRLIWYDRAGTPLGTLGEIGQYSGLTLSHDENRVAVNLISEPGRNRDIWTIDVARSVTSRFTFDPGDDSFAIWSPDDSQLVFHSERPPGPSLRIARASGNALDEVLLKGETGSTLFPGDWSSDGRFIAYVHAATGPQNIWILPTTGDRKPFPFVNTPFLEDSPAFSPDGRWIAYASSESGTPQVYVRPFPQTDGQFQVSRDGGGQPKWRADGRELFFVAPDRTLMAVPVETADTFESGLPRAVFPTRRPVLLLSPSSYAVTKDGKKFLILSFQETSVSSPITVVVNWLTTIRK
jgi:Tol biopolymer transport system component